MGTAVIDAEAMVGLFPTLPADLIREVVAENGDQMQVALKHLLLLLDGCNAADDDTAPHWLPAIKAEATNRPLMILLRGLPGSGKSTLAAVISMLANSDFNSNEFDPGEKRLSVEVVSTDDYFVDSRSGKYVFRSEQLSDAHSWAQAKAKKIMAQKRTDILVIDNTNLQAWEMVPYCKMAAEHKFCVLHIEPSTPWKTDVAVLAKKTRHAIPAEKIKGMKNRFEEHRSMESVVCGLPLAFRPEVTSIAQIIDSEIARRAGLRRATPSPPLPPEPENGFFDRNERASPEQPEYTPTTDFDKNEDFISLMRCFPNLSVMDIFPLYVQSQGNLEVAVNLLLDFQAGDRGESDDVAVILDDATIKRLEQRFGPQQNGVAFPPSVPFSVPKALANVLHFYWRREANESLSRLAASKYASSVASGQPSRGDLETVQSNMVAMTMAGARDTSRDREEDIDGPTQKSITREEINNLKERRAELYNKAAMAFKSRKGGVAAYYSEEGRRLTDVIFEKESEFRYQRFVQSSAFNGHSLDLHGLSVSEAVEMLEWFVDRKYEELLASKAVTMRLEIITGRGSKGWKVKIKPAVVRFLTQREMPFSETDNPGCIQLVIKRS